MQHRIDRFQSIVGMQRDTSPALFNRDQRQGQFYFDAKNIRLTANVENTQWSFCNEQGTMNIGVSLKGTPVGDCVVDNKWVIFTANMEKQQDEAQDKLVNRIYLFIPTQDGDTTSYTLSLLYEGNLNMLEGNTISTKFFYENEQLQKVYWIDGINQCRVINIAADEKERGKWLTRKNPFDFVPELSLKEQVSIKKNHDAGGIFDPGVLQYFISYVNFYGQESNIFYASPLLYTSIGDRGGMYSVNADTTQNNMCNNSFTITVDNVQSEYDYMRIYSILRTSLNDTPQAKIVTEINIQDNIKREEIKVIDQEARLVLPAQTNSTSCIRYSKKQNYILLREQDGQLYKLTEAETKSVLGELKTVQSSAHRPFPPGSKYYELSKSSNNNLYIQVIEDATSFIEGSIIGFGNASTIYIAETPSMEGPYPGDYIITNNLDCIPDSVFAIYGAVPIKEGEKSHTEYIDTLQPIVYTDTNAGGSVIQPTDLFFVGGAPFSAEAFEQKDNTLFLGNISTSQFSYKLPDNLEQQFKEVLDKNNNDISLGFNKSKTLELGTEGINPYKCQLDLTSYQYKVFKYLETYRLGLQFQDKYGRWSNVIHLKDIVNENPLETPIQPINDVYSIKGNQVKWKVPKLTIRNTEANITLINELKSLGYKKVRPVVVYPEYTDRTTIMQGVVSPTVYQLKNRTHNQPYVQSSWFFRPNPGHPDNNTEIVVDGTTIGYRGHVILQLPTKAAEDTDAVLTVGDKITVTLQGKQTDTKNDYEGNITYLESVSNQAEPQAGSTSYSYYLIIVKFPDNIIIEVPEGTIADNLMPVKVFSVKCGDTVLANERTASFENSEPVKDTTTLRYYNKMDNSKDPDSGAFIEFRHNYAIPGTMGYVNENVWGKVDKVNVAAEIQDLSLSLQKISEVTTEELINKYKDTFYIDSSIVTFHSPDQIADEAMKNINVDGLGFRIIGFAPLTSNASNVDIITDTPATTQYIKKTFINHPDNPLGFIKKELKGRHRYFGSRVFNSAALWWDEVSYRGDDNHPDACNNRDRKPTGFVIYPWHKSNSLSNSRNRTSYSKDQDKYTAQWPSMTGKLKSKVLANTRTSYSTVFLSKNNLWEPIGESAPSISVFNSNEVTLAQLESNKHSLNYYGNVNTIILPNTTDPVGDIWNCTPTQRFITAEGYPIIISAQEEAQSVVTSEYMPLTFAICRADNSARVWYSRVGMCDYRSSEGKNDALVTGNIKGGTAYYSYYNSMIESGPADTMYDCVATDGVSMKYKSTPHYVINLSVGNQGEQILPWMYVANNPSIQEESIGVSSYADGAEGLFILPQGKNVKPSRVDVGYKNPFGYLWIGELYRKNVPNRFGGDSNGAKELNAWLPCGDGVGLDAWTDVNGADKELNIVWEEGDTYYQRYDCVKTYPYTMQDPNQLYDTVSFMCESRVNLDGRYDLNRGNSNNLAIQPGVNFNLFNPVYSQKNNFFTYGYFNTSRITTTKFPNELVWSETKISGSTVDQWTSIGLINTLALDGDKGSITSLNKIKNNLIALQQHGIALIRYNENIQISPDNGLPIQLANSNKVDGKYYVSEVVGSQSRQTIQQTEKGIYFIDGNEHVLYGFDGQSLIDISTNKSMASVFKEGTVTKILYDRYLKDLYLIGIFDGEEKTLAFNENIEQFTSFYSYNKMVNTAVINNIPYSYAHSFKTTRLYKMYSSQEYCNFFDTKEDYYITYISSPSQQDKIFTNLDFTADSWDYSNNITDICPFGEIETWNEYQKGIIGLSTSGYKYDGITYYYRKEVQALPQIGESGILYYKTPNHLYYIYKDGWKNIQPDESTSIPSSLKRKFRIWGVNIPRHNTIQSGNISSSRARMRNPWLYIKLKGWLNTKAIFNNLDVHYYE